MKIVIDDSGRVQVWLYTVSHGQLLLRRPKDLNHPRRLELLFKDVIEVHLVRSFINLRVVEMGRDKFDLSSSVPELHRIFKLTGDNAVGYVVAGVVVFAEDDLEYYDPSPLIEQ